MTHNPSAVNATKLSRRICLSGSSADIRVPFFEVARTETLVQNGTLDPRREASPLLRALYA